MGKRVTLCTVAVGCGHSMAAKAIMSALRERDATLEVELIEALDLAPRWFAVPYRDGYLRMIRHAPKLTGKLYDFSDVFEPTRGMGHRIESHVMRDLVRHPLIQSADMVITTHFLCGRVLSWARMDGTMKPPLAVCVTDQHPHGLWLTPHADLTLVASDEAKCTAVQAGVREGRVEVTGIPIHTRFANIDGGAARRELGVQHERAVILVSGGGLGLGGLGEVVRELMAQPAGQAGEAHVVVVCGNNAALKEEMMPLERTPQSGMMSCQVLGYTTQMAEWMSIASVLISKPGGLTTAEACAVGLPMVLVKPIPGQEERNAERLVSAGAAELEYDGVKAARGARAIALSAERRAKMSAAAKGLGDVRAAQRVVEASLKMLEKSGYAADGSFSPGAMKAVSSMDGEPCRA
ncbi:MAG: hypothetical protein KGS45_02535 [Planctomycetes bacterium]|nr:hypothetical protein [Planctomycetota bacterium]